jgi:predicted Zn-dependent protease
MCAVVLCSLAGAPGKGKPTDFQFTKIDLKLLADSDALDHHIEEKGLLYPDRDLGAYVQGIATRLLGGKPAPERVQYNVRVLRDPVVNAFASANGSIYLTTGVLAALDNEADLASIIAREIAHVANRHPYRENRISRQQAVARNLTVASLRLGGGVYAQVGLYLVRNEVAAWIYSNGYAEAMEKVADQDELNLMTTAGYDPESAPRTFETLDEKLEVELATTTYRNHDKIQKRIKALRELIGSGAHANSGSAASAGDYLTHVSAAVCDNIAADLESRRARTALARAQRLVSWQPARAEYLTLLADAYRALGAKTAEPTPKELTYSGNIDRRDLEQKTTPEEEQAKWLAQSGGPEVKAAHEAAAEKFYLEAVGRDTTFAVAHRGLGMLYQQQSKNDAAVREYRKYLECAPANAIDRLRFERRIEDLSKAPVSNPRTI